MKKAKILFYVLMFLPLALTLVALVVLPDRVPIHYNLAGTVDGWGSKYVNLLFPAVTVLMGLFFVALRAGYARKTGTGQEKILLAAGCGTLILFNVMTAIFLGQAYLTATRGANVSMDFSRILFTLTGVLFIAMGNVLPKLRRNSLIGVRTAQSKESDENWRKSQMTGGVAFILTGLALVIGTVFFVPEVKSVLFSVACLLIMIPLTLVALYLGSGSTIFTQRK